MADTQIWVHTGVQLVDGDSGWLDTSGYDTLDIDLSATVVKAAAGSFPNVQFYVERQQADGDILQDWATELDGPRQYSVGIGPSLEVDKPVGDKTRVRWTLGGGSATFVASVVGR